MDASASTSGDVAALRPEVEQATSSCPEFVTVQIELSKRHWSELSKPIADGISVEEAAAAKLDNQEVFKKWRSHPKWGHFFRTFGYSFGWEDERFAFLMVKEHGDLRSLIGRKMVEGDHGYGPFSKEVDEEIMHCLAKGMDYLHCYNIIHRDLKASNILVYPS